MYTIIISIPQKGGRHVLLDMAQSQFSFGKLQTYSLAGNKLPVEGGDDADGNLTDDPDAIWKKYAKLMSFVKLTNSE